MPKKVLFFSLVVFLFFILLPKTQAATFVDLAKFKNLTKQNLTISVDAQTKNLTYLSGAGKSLQLTNKAKLKTNVLVGQQFFKDYGKYFGVNNFSKDLGFLKEKKDSLGLTHLIYEQRYGGVPVYGGSLAVHLNKDATVRSALGRIISNISLNTKPKINQAKAVAAVKDYAVKKLGMAKPQIRQNKLYVYNRSVLASKINSKNYLAYFFEVVDDRGDGRNFVFLNAQDGKVIDQFTGNKTVINREVYDCSHGGGCWDAVNERTATSTAVRTETSGPYALGQTNELFNILGHAHEYFLRTHGIDGANGLGGTGRGAGVHPSGLTIGLSYYTEPDYCLNASWFGGWGVKFCENAPTLSIVGHEYGHAVNDYQVNNNFQLLYQGEQGAIDEAWADVWGQAVQRYFNNASSSNWHIGSFDAVFRDLADPESMDDPDNYYSNDFECHTSFTEDNDKGAVHRNSTVISHAAYLMSMGGEKNGCSIAGIGQEKVEKIFFKALRDHFLAGMTFNMANDALKEACQELYGVASYECVQVRNSLKAVYLNQSSACTGAKLESPKCEVALTPEMIRRMAESLQSRIEILPNLSDRINTEIISPRNQDLIDNNLPEIQAPGLNNEPPAILVTPIPTPTPTVFLIPTPTPTVFPIPTLMPTPIPTPVPTPTPTPTPISTPTPEPEVRTPSFDVAVIQNGIDVTINGVLNYYGKGAKCSGPRYFDPIIVRWGQVDSQPTLKSDNTFTASHTYKAINSSYNLSVSVTNSCFGSYTFRKTIYF